MVSLVHHEDRISLCVTAFFFSHPTNPQNAIRDAVFLLPLVGNNNPSELRSTKLLANQGSVGTWSTWVVQLDQSAFISSVWWKGRFWKDKNIWTMVVWTAFFFLNVSIGLWPPRKNKRWFNCCCVFKLTAWELIHSLSSLFFHGNKSKQYLKLID